MKQQHDIKHKENSEKKDESQMGCEPATLLTCSRFSDSVDEKRAGDERGLVKKEGATLSLPDPTRS